VNQVLIAGGEVIDPAHGIHGQFDVLVEGEQVLAVEPAIAPKPGWDTIDATGHLVMPGLVDTHVHMCQPFGSAVGHRMLAKAGVTCALDMAGEPGSYVAGIREQGAGITTSYVYPLVPGDSISGASPSTQELTAARDQALQSAALGVKVLGGHYPLTPEATRATIQLAAERQCWCAVHAGTTHAGSDIDGLEELVDLAGGLPVHIAHVNSYCRGQRTGNALLEATRAIAAVAGAPRTRSESYLGLINGTSATVENGVPRSNVTKTCLQMGGFPPTAEGLEAAILAGWALIQGDRDGETVLLPPAEGLNHYRDHHTAVGLSFPVNSAAVGIAIATAKEDGAFVVTAISTDGGAIPRNTTLRQGLALVAYGALSLDDLVTKACHHPAIMMGLPAKGHLGPGADADIAIVDPATATPTWVLAHGEIIVRQGQVVGRGGRVATTPAGMAFVREAGLIPLLAEPDWILTPSATA
jgi:cytosine/adenosine deaminase-related metal-dependent hydrolase